jgi:NADH-quinone oxidoreductase subunit L
MEHISPAPWLFLIPLLPLLGAFINGAFGLRIYRRYGETPIHSLAILMPGLSFVITAAYFIKLMLLPAEQRTLLCHLYDWIKIGSFTVPMAFLFDPLSGTMTLMITFVGTLIHVYSSGYMHNDKGYWRFFAYLNLFMFAMLTLILADNFLLMFIGWEGVGLCSYLLISFWYQDLKNARAGMKAFITNRVGDFGFIIGLFGLSWALGGSWDHGHYTLTNPENVSLVFRHVKEVAHLLGGKTIFGIAVPTFACLFFFWGATAKSAQIPLYVWLPDAMAGPTPVSALIHAATMVTAGVYMVARLNFLFAMSPVAMTMVATVGALTALFAATIGLFQYDIKKVLAYSTVSQLGYMFLAVGTGAYWVGIFHLLTHAFFKACLFLGSGSVIHGMHHAYHATHNHHDDPQDMRNMGGLGEHMPITKWTYLAACGAIAGVPFLSGFFSKDEILWKTFSNGNTIIPGEILWLFGAMAAVMTAFYMFRSYFMTFTGDFRGGKVAEKHIHESPWSISGVLIVLGVLSVGGGLMGLPQLWHLPNYLESWLEPVFEHSQHLLKWDGYHHTAEWLLMIFSICLAFTGIGAAVVAYKDGQSTLPAQLLAKYPDIHRLIFNKYYIDEIYQATVIRGSVVFSEMCDWFDKNVIDRIINIIGYVARFISWVHGLHDTYIIDGAVNGVAHLTALGGRTVRSLQTGSIQTYLYGVLGGGLALILIRFIIL